MGNDFFSHQSHFLTTVKKSNFVKKAKIPKIFNSEHFSLWERVKLNFRGS